MVFKIIEVHYVNRFLENELPKSIGLIYSPKEIKQYFNIKPKNGIWNPRKKKQKKGKKEGKKKISL